MAHSNETQGDLMWPFLNKLLAVVQFTVQMSKLNGLGKTHWESIFVVELNLKLRSLFHYKQIVEIKWMKVPSFSLTVTKHLTFELSRYFLWTIKINCRRFWISVNQSDLREREQRGFISYLSTWGSDRSVWLKILPSRKNEIYLWKMATKVGMYSAIHKSVTVARGQR